MFDTTGSHGDNRVVRSNRFGRRLLAAALVAAFSGSAWSACASGTLTASQMVCCAEHHDECDMANMTESCCSTDERTRIEILKPERADETLVPATYLSVAALELRDVPVSLLAASYMEPRTSSRSPRLRPHLLHAVLLI